MKKIITTLSFAFLMAMGLINSASAVNLNGVFSGLGIGISAAHGGFYGEGTEDEEGNETGEDDVTEAGAFTANFGSVFVEYDFGPISLGVDYIPNAIETPKNLNTQGTLKNTVMAEFKNHTTAYAIIPVPLGGLYLKAGAIYVDVKSIETLETGGSYPDTDTTGITAGLGYAVEAGNGVSVRAEILAAQYDKLSVKNSVENPDRISSDDVATVVSVDEMMAASARISIIKTF
tara:strand:- start:262 stop:957 length:696 start_codon:yes stop_codon:yes gene_type:complete